MPYKASYIGNKTNYVAKFKPLENNIDFSKGPVKVKDATAAVLALHPKTFSLVKLSPKVQDKE